MTSTTTMADVANKIAAVVNRGAVSGSITTSGGTYTIAAGYHNGSGKVTGPTLASLITIAANNVTLDNNARLLSGYTAYGKNGVKYTGTHTCPTLSTLVGNNVTLDDAGYLLSGQTAYGKNGTKITGSMKSWAGTPNKIQNRRIANNRFEVAVDAGYHGCYWAGNSYEYMEFSEVASTLGLTAAKLVSGNIVCGVTGTHTCPSLGTLIGSNVTLDNAANLLSGVTAYGKNGNKYTGTNQGYTAGYNAGANAKSLSNITGDKVLVATKNAKPATVEFTNLGFNVGLLFEFALGAISAPGSGTVTLSSGTSTEIFNNSYTTTTAGSTATIRVRICILTNCNGATLTIKHSGGNSNGHNTRVCAFVIPG